MQKQRISIRAVPPEVAFALALLAVAEIVSVALGLPFILPATGATAFVGVHYFVPLLAILAWYAMSALTGGRARLMQFTVALACYGFVMWLHFNIKLWSLHINPLRFDAFYWQTDQAIRPLVDLCFRLRGMLAELAPNIDRLYLLVFMALFFVSFCVHAVRSQEAFRKVLLAATIFQGLGALAYCVMPALGPFLYEQGASAVGTATQAGMLEVYQQSMAGGADWMRRDGADYLIAGLAAMPSLHAGGSWLFLWFVARYEKPLLLIYVPAFLFILIEAVATRWHYVIDLPVGIALAQLSIFLAYRFDWTGDRAGAARLKRIVSGDQATAAA